MRHPPAAPLWLLNLNSKVFRREKFVAGSLNTRARGLSNLPRFRPPRVAARALTRKELRVAAERKESLTESYPPPEAARTGVDSTGFAPIECSLGRDFGRRCRRPRGTTPLSLIKIIIITLAVILSLLFFGRFLF